MKRISLWMIILGMVATGCSNHEKSEEQEVADVEEIGSEADFLVDADSDFLFEEDLVFEDESYEQPYEEVVAESEPAPVVEEPVEETYYDEEYMETETAYVEPASAPSPSIGQTDKYVVKKGETLMMVAFKIYGDYMKWRDIKAWNPNVSTQALREGDILEYEVPAQKFEWNPQGNPHLVQRGETLGTISDDKYGTMNRWREIFDNNQPLIKDPNLIFAGFTLYYIPDRDLASENGY